MSLVWIAIVGTIFQSPFAWIKNTLEILTWHCCMCCNPANGRVDIEERLTYETQLERLEWNETNVPKNKTFIKASCSFETKISKIYWKPIFAQIFKANTIIKEWESMGIFSRCYGITHFIFLFTFNKTFD